MPGNFIEVRDPRFHRLIHGSAGLDKLWTGGRWAEGPAYFPAGRYLIWSDIPNDRLMRWDETSGHVSVFEQPCRNQNGHTVDREGRLLACEHRGRCVSRIEADGSRTVLADPYDGKRLNSPNDVVVKSDGSIWFTDPSYGIDSDYEGDAAPSEIGASNVYRIDPADGDGHPGDRRHGQAERPRLLARRVASSTSPTPAAPTTRTYPEDPRLPGRRERRVRRLGQGFRRFPRRGSSMASASIPRATSGPLPATASTALRRTAR